MKVLFIGGTSFIGRQAVEQLLESGHEVTVFHRGNTNNVRSSGYHEIFGQRDDLRRHASVLREVRPDVVVDMIAHRVEHAADLLQVFGGVVGRIVLISSCNVYRSFQFFTGDDSGPVECGPLREDSLLRGIPVPGDDKLSVEHELLRDSRVETTILRLPMVHGPGDPQHRFYDLARRFGDRRSVILMEKNHSQVRMPRTHVKNVGRAIVLAVSGKASPHWIFNVADLNPPTEWELWRSAARISGWQGEIKVVENEEAPPFLQNPFQTEHPIVVDSSRIRDSLGFLEVIGREDGLSDTLRWEQSHPPLESPDYVTLYAEEDAYLKKIGGV